MAAGLPYWMLFTITYLSAAGLLALLLAWVGLLRSPVDDVATIAAGLCFLALSAAIPAARDTGMRITRLVGLAAALLLIGGAALRLLGAGLTGEPNLPVVTGLGTLGLWLLLTAVTAMGPGSRWVAALVGGALWTLVLVFLMSGVQPHRMTLASPLPIVVLGAALVAAVAYVAWATAVGAGLRHRGGATRHQDSPGSTD
ncbi:MAG: hypothetical protein WEB29_04535 [Chloroflexota bacterium]